jgi:hypothetical protein
MSDIDLVIIFILLSAGLAGAIGGIIAGWLKQQVARAALQLPARADLAVDLVLHAPPVSVPIRVQQPDAVVVEIVTAGGPTQRELAARVIATLPSIGPTDLAQIVQCAKSTAHAMIRDAREGRLALPDVEIEEAE